jgi:hypothetical protein
VDDIRGTAPEDTLFGSVGLVPTLKHYLELEHSPALLPGSKVESPKHEKYRTRDIIATVPRKNHAENTKALLGFDEKTKSASLPSKPPKGEPQTEPVETEKATVYREATGSSIYLSLDRREAKFTVKELARKMHCPTVDSFKALKHFGHYLCGPELARVVLVSPQVRDEYHLNDVGKLRCWGYSDTDWAGCPETRRSSGNVILGLGSAVIPSSTQTQPGVPGTSSLDAELREFSRLARYVLFLQQLAEQDFGLRTEMPEIYTDSAVGLQSSKKLGPGTKLRHLEVCHFFVEETQRAGLLEVRKTKGTVNPANWNTKHHSNPKALLDALPGFGMASLDSEKMREIINDARHLKVCSYTANGIPIYGNAESDVRRNSSNATRRWKLPGISPGTAQLATLASLVIRSNAAEQYEFTETPEQEDSLKDWSTVLLLALGVIEMRELCFSLYKRVLGRSPIAPEPEVEPAEQAEPEQPEAAAEVPLEPNQLRPQGESRAAVEPQVLEEMAGMRQYTLTCVVYALGK